MVWLPLVLGCCFLGQPRRLAVPQQLPPSAPCRRRPSTHPAALPLGPPRQAMGSDLSPDEVAALFKQADANADGTVDADELAAVLTACHREGEFAR